MGEKFLVAFFCFGTAMCLLTILLLAFPGGALEPIWRLKPEARQDFHSLGGWAFPLMVIVGAACGLSALGLAARKIWGRWLAIAVLLVNLLGDTASALVRQDYRTLIGLPIGGAMIFYLWKRAKAQESAAT
ncbi:MAG: hypothetical protein ABI946_06890 [Chthoniobacterales bacterium]